MGGIPESVTKISTSAGLKVLIVGAGIGGLSAAIQLAQQGHDVQVSVTAFRKVQLLMPSDF